MFRNAREVQRTGALNPPTFLLGSFRDVLLFSKRLSERAELCTFVFLCLHLEEVKIVSSVYMSRKICITAADGHTASTIGELLLTDDAFKKKYNSLTGLSLKPDAPHCKELTELGSENRHSQARPDEGNGRSAAADGH
jgi:hypothetical protein